MRALVVSNCATATYAEGLKVLFPDWEVRGAMIDLAEKWLTADPPHQAFAGYLKVCDLYVGLPLGPAWHIGQLLPEETRRVIIPGFAFLGLQPDCLHLNGFESVLGGGNLYSRIVVASYVAGLTPERTAGLFNPETYEAFDFFSYYEQEESKLVDNFRSFGIDLSGCIGRWISRGNFLFSYNHPRVDVLTGILRRALVAARLLPESEWDRDDDMGVADHLLHSIWWPVYPEIAARHGLDGSLIWRKGRAAGYERLHLDQFITASFSALAAKPLPEIRHLPNDLERIKALIA